MTDIVDRIEEKAKTFFTDARGSHGWDHVVRVRALCEHIGPSEGCDMTVLRLSAILHDVGREECDKVNGEKCHAEVGAELTAKILAEEGVSADLIDEVAHCVASHRFRNNVVPQSDEARVLYDADKLDSIGAVGVGRAFLFAGEIGAMLHDPNVDHEKTRSYSPDDTAYREYLAKLRHIHDKMLTPMGKEMAEERNKFMAAFFDRLNFETAGDL